MKDAELVKRELMLAAPKRFVHELLSMPDGHRIDWYYVDTPRSVMMAPVTASGNVILVRQYRYNLKTYTLELPAGTVGSEEDPEAAALRELREETGFGPTSQHHPEKPISLGSYFSLPSETNRYTYFFLISPVHHLENPRGDSQIEKYFDMSVEELPFQDAVDLIGEEIIGVETTTCLLLAQRLLFQQG